MTTTPSGENLFIARALKASDGTAGLAIIAAGFLEVLHARPGLEGARLEPTDALTDVGAREGPGQRREYRATAR
jgi:hypothetical protein